MGEKHNPFEVSYFGNMELNDYIAYLNIRRHFNSKQIIEHTLKVYGIDLTEALAANNYYIQYKTNFYGSLKQKNSKKSDDGTRSYFNTYGRNQYLNFMNYSHFNTEDCLSPYYQYSDIHHIYPLAYGGNSSIENLIHINEVNHDLLHENPLEEYEEYCHKAVDYLGYLYTDNQIRKTIMKYKLTNFGVEMFMDMFPGCIKQEMKLFYKYIIEEFDRHRTSREIHRLVL